MICQIIIYDQDCQLPYTFYLTQIMFVIFYCSSCALFEYK